MPPIRRYLRITKYSVLECRIYLEEPTLAQTWLLNPRDPALPRVIESVRPLVLPKLVEERERERTRRKGAKKRYIRDVVETDDFQVAIFLTETPTRHSLLLKHKHFRDKIQTKLTSNSSKLTGASRDLAINVDDDPNPLAPDSRFLRCEIDVNDEGMRHAAEGSDDHVVIAEESDVAGGPRLDQIPLVPTARPGRTRSQKKRHRQDSTQNGVADTFDGSREVLDLRSDSAESDTVRDSKDSQDGSENDGPEQQGGGGIADVTTSINLLTGSPPSKRRRRRTGPEGDGHQDDDKSKLAMDISYEGFSIYGRVLCLVVTRRQRDGNQATSSCTKGPRVQGRGRAVSGRGADGGGASGGQASAMENWIASTQLQMEQMQMQSAEGVRGNFD